MLRWVQNEIFTFDIDSENAFSRCTLERWNIHKVGTNQHSNFRRLQVEIIFKSSGAAAIVICHRSIFKISPSSLTQSRNACCWALLRRVPAQNLQNGAGTELVLSGFTSLCSFNYSAAWKWEMSSRKWRFYGQWLRNWIWTGAGKNPFCAEECLYLFQNIVFFSGQQFLTADSRIWRKLRKVQSDMWSYKWICPDETTYKMQRVLIYYGLKLSVPLISFIIKGFKALLTRQAEWATLSPQIFLKICFCLNELCLPCCDAVCMQIEFMLYLLASIRLNFHIPGKSVSILSLCSFLSYLFSQVS